MTAPGPSVLVLGQGTRAFLAVIRSLGRQGLRVHVGMCPPDDLALRSRYVFRRHDIPAHEGSGSAWLAAVRGVLESGTFELLLACDDQSMIPVQLHRDELGSLTRAYSYPPETYRVAFDKVESTRLAQRLGVNVAAQREIGEETDVDGLVDALGLPMVLKPPSSFDEADLGTRREVVRVRTRAELRAGLEQFARFDRAIAQENVLGVGVGVEVLASRGQVLVAFQHERVHEPLEGGGSSYRRSVAPSGDLLDATCAIVAALEYTGVAMVEFKRNRQTGRWIFVEINGRFWGSLPLAVAAGADFPWYLYQLLVEGRTSFPPTYRVGLHARSLLADFYWLGSNLRADRGDPTLATVPLARLAGEVVNVLALRERIDSLAADDPSPFLGEVALLARRVAGKLASVARDALWHRGIARRVRAARLRARFRSARHVLFLCYGNICRSPFAARYAEGVFAGRAQAASSGVHQEGGRSSPALACEVAAAMGVDLAAHRSSVLDRESVERADLILVFDEKNETDLLARYPEAASKTAYLGLLARRGPVIIEDPYGGSEAAFVSAYERIRACVDALVR